MWGPISKRDADRYAKYERERLAREGRREKLKAQMPERLALMNKVKAGEMTLEEAQAIARNLK